MPIALTNAARAAIKKALRGKVAGLDSMAKADLLAAAAANGLDVAAIAAAVPERPAPPDGPYVVIAWHADPKSVVPPYRGDWVYQPFPSMSEAADYFTDLGAGEYPGVTAYHLCPIGATGLLGDPLRVSERRAA